MSKKLFILALGALLVVAFTMPAMAASKVDFSGTFRVRAHYQNNFTLNPKSEWESKMSRFDQRLRIDFKIMPTDALTMNIGLTTEDQIWGRQGKSHFVDRAYGNAGTTDSKLDFEIRYAWMDIKSPFGLFQAGRMPGGKAGLSLLGWSGSTVMGAGIGDNTADDGSYGNSGARDRLQWTLPMGPFTLNVCYDKLAENDSSTGAAALGNMGREYDQDWDEYSVTGIYKFANGGVAMTMAYDRGHAQFQNIAGTVPLAALLPPQVVGRQLAGNTRIDFYYWAFIPALALNFGPFGIHTELTYATGKANWKLAPGTPSSITDANGVSWSIKDNADLTAFQWYIDATYNYGPGVVGLWYQYTSGDKTATDYTMDGLAIPGADFAPLFIAYDRGLGAGTDHYLMDNYGTTGFTYQTGGAGLAGSSNHWTLGVWWDHSVTEDLMVHAAYGYMDVLNAGRNRWADYGRGRDIKKHYGQEFDVSLVYTIMSNLTVQLDMGYFWAGDYWKQGWGSLGEIEWALANGLAHAYNDAQKHYKSWEKAGNAYGMKTTLMLKF
ncbi:MAG: porin [Thermodesulfobacteriota bacterium]